MTRTAPFDRLIVGTAAERAALSASSYPDIWFREKDTGALYFSNGVTWQSQVSATGTFVSPARKTAPGTAASLPYFHIDDFGAAGDGVETRDAVMTNGSAVLTSTRGPFLLSDVGKVVSVVGAASGVANASILGSTIASYQSPTQVTLADAATATVSAATAWWGTDNTAAINACGTALTATTFTTLTHVPGTRMWGPGLYCAKGPITLIGAIKEVGTGTNNAVGGSGNNFLGAAGTVLRGTGKITGSGYGMYYANAGGSLWFHAGIDRLRVEYFPSHGVYIAGGTGENTYIDQLYSAHNGGDGLRIEGSANPCRLGFLCVYDNGGAGLWLENQTQSHIHVGYVAGDNNATALVYVNGFGSQATLTIDGWKAERGTNTDLHSPGHPDVIRVHNGRGGFIDLGRGYVYAGPATDSTGSLVRQTADGGSSVARVAFAVGLNNQSGSSTIYAHGYADDFSSITLAYGDIVGRQWFVGAPGVFNPIDGRILKVGNSLDLLYGTVPEGAKTASPGSQFLDTAGRMYVKETGTGNTGWSRLRTRSNPAPARSAYRHENIQRLGASFGSGAALASGTLFVVADELEAGWSLSSITFHSGSTAMVSGTHQWFALFSSALVPLALTADDTSTAWAANSDKTLAVTGAPYLIPSTGLYYWGICVAAATPPTLVVVTGNAGINAGSPAIAGTSSTGLTDPASCPSPVASVSGSGFMPWVAFV